MAASLPTKQAPLCRKLEHDGPTRGFDTIAFTFEANPRSARLFGRSIDLGCGANLSEGFHPRMRVQVNVPKFASGVNVFPASWPAVEGVLRAVYGLAAEHARPRGTFEDIRFTRVDVVRDFLNVREWETLGPRIAGIARHSVMKTYTVQPGSIGGSFSVAVRNKERGVCLYDKGAESMLPSAQGRLRCEGRLGPRWIERAGIALSTAGQSHAILQQIFETVGFGRRVVSMEAQLANVLRNSGLSERDQAGLMGFMLAEHLGYYPQQSRGTRAKYRKIARALGIALDFEQGSAWSRLDFESGTQEWGVA